LGQREIINILKQESKIREDFLAPKQIKKALENLGHIIREDTMRKSLIKVRKNKNISIKTSNTYNKRYKWVYIE